MSKSKFVITQDEIKKNIEAMQSLAKQKDLDWIYISSFDEHLNEYVPLFDCHRYYFTGFTGSVADVLIPKSGKVKLYIDGRYFEQADIEIDHSIIHVVKTMQDTNKGIVGSMKDDVKAEHKIGYEAKRTPLTLSSYFKEKQLAQALDSQIQEVINYRPKASLAPIRSIESKVKITSVADKLKRVSSDLNDNEALFLSALDDIAWVSNCRGYHLDNLSSFYSRAVLTSQKLYIFLDEGLKVEAENPAIEFIFIKDNFEEILKDIQVQSGFEKILYDSSLINSSDYSVLVNLFGNGVQERKGGLIPYKSIKDNLEQELIRESFRKSNKAITETINWVRDSLANSEKITELDLYHKTSFFYEKNGAVTQSFNTISGVGAASSIIHFSSPSADKIIQPSDIVLLDSGGYFDSGFATDTTRTFLAGKEANPNPKHVEIFTKALKGFFNLLYAQMKVGESGVHADKLARDPIIEAGYDFAHSVGHGVGVYVHEDGIRFSGKTDYTIAPGQVVSVEPGIYLKGIGGVRHENIVIVQPHPSEDGVTTLENLTWIEFDEKLIDRSILNEQETNWLDQYQKRCQEIGNTLN